MSAECEGLFGRLFGHKFQPQYETTPPPDDLFAGMTRVASGVVETMTTAYTKKTYVRDVCKRCGKSIERPTK